MRLSPQWPGSPLPMSRPLRVEYPGALYHVTSRGDRREPIYLDALDRRAHLEVIARAFARFDAHAMAYCLMDNHYHLVIRTRRANLSRLMRHVNGVYTQRFNRRHGLVGHLFQGRYSAILVDRDAYLWSLCRYVERNPVAARLVDSAADWPWSSHRAHVALSPAPDWLDVDGLYGFILGYSAVTAAQRRRAAVLHRESVDGQSDPDLMRSRLRQQVFLGDERFIERTLSRQGLGSASPDGVPRVQTRRPRSLAAELGAHADHAAGMYSAYRRGGFTMVEIARHVGLSVSRVSRLIAATEARIEAGAKGKT